MDTDILDIFNSETDHEPFKEVNESVKENETITPTNNNRNTNKNESLYSRKDYQPMEIDVSNYNRTGKSFTVYVPDGIEVPEEYANKLKNIVSSLTGNGYELRANCDSNNFVNELVKVSKNTKFYLPWGKFNEGKEGFVRPDYSSYRVALGLRKKFFELPDAVRAIIASNVQTVLGRKCKDPVNFVVVYSASGADTKTDYKDIKIDQEKNLFTIMHISNKGGILYFNIKNDDAINKLKEVIKNSS